MKLITKLPTLLKLSFIAAVLSSSLMADCTYQLFNITSNQGTRISEYIDQLSDECSYTVIIKDKQAKKMLQKRLNKVNLKDRIITEVLDTILLENNLAYTLKDDVLKISYLITKTYNLDYIISERTGTSSTNITLSSTSGSGDGAQLNQASTSQASQGESQSGLEIKSEDNFQLWNSIQEEVQAILNRPEDKFKATIPTINKEAGFITVTATNTQIKRLDAYLANLQKKIKAQVMIDVHLYSVTLSDAKATGIDWSQIFSLQNFKLTSDVQLLNNVTTLTTGAITAADAKAGPINAHGVEFTGAITINDLVKYLKEQGDVRSVSNPKILTLNNQSALISVGNQFFYKITQSTSANSAGGTTISQNDVVDSVFAGILLDITPEISDDGRVTLKINPSISEIIGSVASDSASRNLPPDLSRKQLSSVITANDGEQVVLGGLIGTTETNKVNKVPLLGDIPLLGMLFKSSRYQKETSELVVVVTPHIIKPDNALSLKDMGYQGILDKDVKNNHFIPTFDKKLFNEVNDK